MDRDWLDYVGAFSGLVGALLAAVAIVYAAHQSIATNRQLVRERRLEFELGLLAEIRRQMSITGTSHLVGYVGALIIDPSDETDLPLLRAVLAVKAGPRGKARRAELEGEGVSTINPGGGGVLLHEVENEVDASIARRLVE